MAAEPLCAARLRAVLVVAEPLLREISDADSARQPGPGEWSPRQVIGHLIDSASNNHQRFVRAALQDDLVFPGYAQVQWVALQRYDSADWSDLLTLWLAFNRHLASVMCSVPVEARLRVRARHNLDEIAANPPASAAQATLDYFMSDYVVHLEGHMQQILGARWQLGASGRSA